MWIPVVLCLLAALALGFLAIIGYLPTRHAWTAARVAWAIKTKLPMGSSQARVIELLTRLGQERLPVGGADSSASRGFVGVVIRDAFVGLLFVADVQFFFYFDEDGKMKERTVLSPTSFRQ